MTSLEAIFTASGKILLGAKVDDWTQELFRGLTCRAFDLGPNQRIGVYFLPAFADLTTIVYPGSSGNMPVRYKSHIYQIGTGNQPQYFHKLCREEHVFPDLIHVAMLADETREQYCLKLVAESVTIVTFSGLEKASKFRQADLALARALLPPDCQKPSSVKLIGGNAELPVLSIVAWTASKSNTPRLPSTIGRTWDWPCLYEGCEEVLDGKYDLKIHLYDAHGHAGGIYHCLEPDCEFSADSESRIRLHHVTHTDFRPHICPDDAHTDEQSFLCDEPDCGHQANSPSALYQHIATVHPEHPSVKARVPRKDTTTMAEEDKPSVKDPRLAKADRRGGVGRKGPEFNPTDVECPHCGGRYRRYALQDHLDRHPRCLECDHVFPVTKSHPEMSRLRSEHNAICEGKENRELKRKAATDELMGMFSKKPTIGKKQMTLGFK
ncbi:hypothetical protein LTR22_024997 [Elasticomyces elasticus]|nr:hypothetical protein LTR22_024997 [Elasticomyces elasticus]